MYCIWFFMSSLQICGILLIIFGALLFSNVHTVEDFAEALKSQQVPITMIVLGIVILMISFFGCCGAIRESYCMSMTVSTSQEIIILS